MSTDLKKPDDAPRTGSAADGAPSDDVGAGGVDASQQPGSAPETDDADGGARVVRRFGTSAEVVELPDSSRETTEDAPAAAEDDMDGHPVDDGDGRPEDDDAADEDEDAAGEGELSPPVHPDSVPGPADSTFSALAGGGMLSLCVFAFLLFWPALSGVGLFCAGEVDTAHLIHRLMDAPWLTPMAGGDTLPPLMFWMLKGLRELLVLGDLPADILLPLFGVLSAAVAIIGVWGLTRALGFGARAGLAAGLMLLISPVFLLLGNTLDTDALATGLMLLSLAGFCWGWTQERAFLSLFLGFVGALAAGMAGGFEFLLVPVVTSIIFLIRRMRFSRAQRWDAVLNFFIFLSLIGAWLTSAILLGGDKGYVAAFSSAFFATAPGLPLDLAGWLLEIPHVSPRLTNFVAITLLPLLPWLILPIFVSWNRAVRDAWQNAKHGEIRPGFLRTALVVTLLVQFFRPGIMLLAFTALAMPLFARALLRLSPFGSRMVHGILALVFLIAGVFAALVSFDMLADVLPPELVAWYAGDLRRALVGMESLPIVAGCCLLAAVILLKFTRKAFPSGALLSLSLLVILVSLPVRLMLLPEAAHLLPGLRGAAALTPAPTKKEPAPAPAPAAKSGEKAAPAPAPAAPAPEAKKEPAPAPAPEKKAEAKPAETAAPAPAPAAPAPEAKKEPAPAPAPEKKAGEKPAETAAPAPAPAAPAPEVRKEPAPAPAPGKKAGEKPAEAAAPAPAPAAPAPEAKKEPAPAPAPGKKAEEKPAETAAPAPAPAAPAPEAKKEPAPAPAPEKKAGEKPAEAAAPAPAPAAPAPEVKKEPAPAPAPEKKAEERPAEKAAPAAESKKPGENPAGKKDPLAGEMKSAPDWDIMGPLKGLIEKIQSNLSPK